mmetsp:Transcript_19450/g.44458  ORF Transcript_19450/g.44458 Transcript_19450/m.44458 type:complete len:125 (-) Transcript_19450:817-1191(-)
MAVPSSSRLGSFFPPSPSIPSMILALRPCQSISIESRSVDSKLTNPQQLFDDWAKLAVYEAVAGAFDAPSLNPELPANPFSVGGGIVGASPPHLYRNPAPRNSQVGVAEPPGHLVEVEHVLQHS